MSSERSPNWPAHLSGHLTLPETNLFHNAEVAAARYPDKPFIVFYDTVVTFAEFKDEAERVAGFLQQRHGVRAGDRVLLNMQNSPQWMIAYYGILRAGAVVVPINPMNLTDELRHYVEDSGARVMIVAQDLYPRVRPLVGTSGLEHVVVATYGDYVRRPPQGLAPPDFVMAPRDAHGPGVTRWCDMLAARLAPGPLATGPDDLCVMPYTSGTTGKPKGCMHTHRGAMCTAVGGVNWFGQTQDTITLSVLPLFHVTGMQGGMNGPLFSGATVVVLPRWDRDAAAWAIERYRVTNWQSIATMVVDFLWNPRLDAFDLSSLRRMSGGGAAMPEAVVQRLAERVGIEYVEGYGLSETIAATHINPPQQPKRQCLGIPVFDVDARVVDPITLEAVPRGETGEIVVHGPQVMRGYWGRPDATRDAFVEIDGKAFLRTGDLGYMDEDGYFFMVDRLKRMINAAGYKVWPAEVEALLYGHPDIQEVCVIAALDPYRGETVKAVVVADPARRVELTEDAIIAWAREHMASYKAPRVVEFVDALPKSGSGKILWRQLQEQEAARQAAQGERKT
ncbi:long-chain fatty acid--CoA ligase [Burkholderia stagnalis]|uniref:long-chain fatty acid--CoA ligase n=1 Tax=Burkholderia stagnalis TaxID=1503054 RepID=UPI0007578A17|nr:long-chain fatty acid--CoA ligase [Burkholderia stagnalis]KVN26192.1 long-chain fatty acid--CoA ligase [Burkholderia stagnalis]KWH43140.1 long-chain fatty acid--CoA ligase [Burkholderia stagnalis]KWH47647.1 long-chain fatty acid--CoA ligase [Burkholderia stagnalis]